MIATPPRCLTYCLGSSTCSVAQVRTSSGLLLSGRLGLTGLFFELVLAVHQNVEEVVHTSHALEDLVGQPTREAHQLGDDPLHESKHEACEHENHSDGCQDRVAGDDDQIGDQTNQITDGETGRESQQEKQCVENSFCQVGDSLLATTVENGCLSFSTHLIQGNQMLAISDDFFTSDKTQIFVDVINVNANCSGDGDLGESFVSGEKGIKHDGFFQV